MLYSVTFGSYLFRQYCKYFFNITLILVIILFLANIFDTFERVNSIKISFLDFVKLAAYKIPYFLNEIAMIITVISSLVFLKNFIINNEFIGALAQGISTLQIYCMLIFTSLFISIIFMIIIGPLGSYGLNKYDNSKAALNNSSNNLMISDNGIYLKEDYAQEVRMIQIKSLMRMQNKLNNLTIIFLDKNLNFIKRVDAKEAYLNKNILRLNHIVSSNHNESLTQDSLELPTNLNFKDFINNFTRQENISIFSLPKFIKRLSSLGIPVTQYQLYFYKQLFKPLTFILAILLASCFSKLSNFNRMSNYSMLIYGLFSGFVFYALIQIIPVVLLNSHISPMFAVLVPIILLILACNFVILHFH